MVHKWLRLPLLALIALVLLGAPSLMTMPGSAQQPGGFTCSVSGDVLTWTDEGASAYYVRSVVGGVETFVGEFSGTSATVPDADSYIVR
ncbi:MAG: hypothetical protein AAGA65_27405, partial [Actinomycetota bacterium]